jgi:hypothetical protein
MTGWAVRGVTSVNPFRNCGNCIQYMTAPAPPGMKSDASFTSRLNRGGLTLPSEDAFLIIMGAESFFLQINPDQFSIKNTSPKLAQALATQFIEEAKQLDAIQNAPSCHCKALLPKLLARFFMSRIRKVLNNAIRASKAKICVDYAGKTALMKTLATSAKFGQG